MEPKGVVLLERGSEEKKRFGIRLNPQISARTIVAKYLYKGTRKSGYIYRQHTRMYYNRSRNKLLADETLFSL